MVDKSFDTKKNISTCSSDPMSSFSLLHVVSASLLTHSYEFWAKQLLEWKNNPQFYLWFTHSKIQTCDGPKMAYTFVSYERVFAASFIAERVGKFFDGGEMEVLPHLLNSFNELVEFGQFVKFY